MFSYDKLYIEGELYEFPANDNGNQYDNRSIRLASGNGDRNVNNTATSSGMS